MTSTITVAAKDVREGDELKTSDGFIRVGGVQSMRGGERVGLFTSAGMIGVDAEDKVTVRREQ